MLKEKLSKLKENKDFSILLVEDEKMVLKAMENMMRRVSDKVVSANDGSQGWELYQQNPFSVVVTDLQMPNMGGAELVKNIKTLNPKQVIIVVTAFRDGLEIDKARQNGADFILEKPFSLMAFLDALESISNET